MSQEDIKPIIRLTTSLITLIAAIGFVTGYNKLRGQNPFFKMVLILSISELIYAATSSTAMFFETYPRAFYATLTLASRFSLYWSAAMSIFTYRIIVKQQSFDIKRFMVKSFFICALSAIVICSLLFSEIWGLGIKSYKGGNAIINFPDGDILKKIAGWGTFYIIGLSSPIFVIIYCYIRVYFTLKKDYLFETTPQHRRRILIYILLPVVCFAPWVIMDTIVFFGDLEEYPFEIGIIVTTLRFCWGFLNLLVFWFLSPEREERERNYSIFTVDDDSTRSSESSSHSQTKQSRSDSLIL